MPLLKEVLHTAARTHARHAGPGRDYYLRRISEGKTKPQAIRAVKRHINNAVYRTLQADAVARRLAAFDLSTPSRWRITPPRALALHQ